jgi:hypothetical protein
VLGTKKADVLSNADYREIGKALGLKFNGPMSDWSGASTADQMLSLYQYARATRRDPYDVWCQFPSDIDWWTLDLVIRTLEEYKDVHKKSDFTDLLEGYLERGVSLPVEVAFIDEYQDLSQLLSDVAEKMFANAERIYYAGDDRQAVHLWAGAEPHYLINFSGEIEVLGHSHRLPRQIFRVANDIAGRIQEKLPQEWTPADKEGVVERAMKPEHVDLSSGEWYLLARNTHHLKWWKDVCRQQGVPFQYKGERSVKSSHVQAIQAWERLRNGKMISGENAKVLGSLLGLDWSVIEGLDYGCEDLGIEPNKPWYEALTAIPVQEREYYQAIKRRGENLADEPRIRIDTYHGTKGGEVPNVALLTDMTNRTYTGYVKQPDAEHRVFYVGVTRASEKLVIVEPQTSNYYRI